MNTILAYNERQKDQRGGREEGEKEERNGMVMGERKPDEQVVYERSM